MHTTLRERLRRLAGREPTPSSAAIIYSQTAKTTERGGSLREWITDSKRPRIDSVDGFVIFGL